MRWSLLHSLENTLRSYPQALQNSNVKLESEINIQTTLQLLWLHKDLDQTTGTTTETASLRGHLISKLGFAPRHSGGKSNPTFWVNNRRAIKILNYEEQQEDDDIVCIIRRTRKLMGSEAVCKLSKELQVRKQVDFKNDGEDGDIVTDRDTHIFGD